MCPSCARGKGHVGVDLAQFPVKAPANATLTSSEVDVYPAAPAGGPVAEEVPEEAPRGVLKKNPEARRADAAGRGLQAGDGLEPCRAAARAQDDGG